MGSNVKHEHAKNIIDKAVVVARTLTYNDDKPQAEAKHLLLELTQCLSAKCTSIGKSGGRLIVINLLGRWRYLTLTERILYRCFNIVPAAVDY